MLNFLDPVNINNLTLFRDDEVANKFYVLPDEPGIPVDSKGLPEFLFLLYLRDAATLSATDESGAGYLQFRTVLTLAQDRRDALVAALRTQLSAEQAAGTTPFGNAITSTEPILADPLWASGTVDLSTFQVSDTGLVRQATSKVPVDLTGDLGASFTVTLSQDGAGVFRGAFDAYRAGAHQLPLVITYNLTYAGRITTTMHIEAKHSVVHERVWQRATPWQLLTDGFPRYVPLQISERLSYAAMPALRVAYPHLVAMIHPDEFGAAVQETISDNSIVVSIKSAPTGDSAADAALQAALLKLATDLITESLMPSLTSGAPVPGANDPSQTTSTTSLMQLDAGAEPGTSTFTLDLDDATSITRPAAPNAPLQVLISDPSTLAACFQELRLSDDFFKQLNVSVSTSGVDFSANGIAKIHVFLRYHEIDEIPMGKPPVDWECDQELDSATATCSFTRLDTARAADGSHKTAYEYMVQVLWQATMATTEIPWTKSTAQNLIITPPQLGAVRVDTVLTAPPNSIDSARVELSYTGANQSVFTGAIELTGANPRGSWLQSTGEVVSPGQAAQEQSYSYQILYRYQDVAITTPAQTTTQQTIEVPTPFAGSVTFALMPEASADTASAIAGTLTYTDAAHGYTVVREVNLTPNGPPQNVTIPVMPGGPRTATCTGRVLNKDGTHLDLPVTTVSDGVNFIGAQGVTPLMIQLRTDLIDFAADVKALHVTLRFTHADGTVTSAEQVFTATSAPTFTWSVPRNPGDGATYDADITFFGIDRSKDQSVSLTGQTSTDVELDRPAPTK